MSFFPAHQGINKHSLRSLALAFAASFSFASLPAVAEKTDMSVFPDWAAVQDHAKDSVVYWNAWGGDEKINAYMTWAGEEVEKRYGVTVNLVKVSDTASVVSQLLAEKTVGRKDQKGSIDLIWINGENFAALKKANMLFGPFTDLLPHNSLVDHAGKPTTLIDFTLPVDGLEAPWGMAQFVFMHDQDRIETPPDSAMALLDWAKSHPGRFTYPQPPDFMGSTFLKQTLIEVIEDPTLLQKPVSDQAAFAAATQPLWSYLEALHPVSWRKGQAFPPSGPGLRQLFADGEVDFALSFHPNEASGLIDQGLLPPSTRTHIHSGGTLGNTHFLAIPANAGRKAKAGAMVLVNFLMSPEAQLKKQDPTIWGDFTVLDLAKIAPEQREAFNALPKGPATLSLEALGTPLLEPHPSWMEALEAEWQKRYGS